MYVTLNLAVCPLKKIQMKHVKGDDTNVLMTPYKMMDKIL